MKKILVILAALAIGLVSCGKGGGNEEKKGLTIVGSDTLLELVQAQSEAFGKKTKIDVKVGGGGSGVGIAKILGGTIDIADASRAMKGKEHKLAKDKGMDIKEVKLAIDAIAVIVNKENKVADLTNEQLMKIYLGEITNWKEVGGADMPIVLYGRQNSSGTFAYFQKKVLHKKKYSAKMNRMTGNSQIVAAINQDKGGIGYVGIGYAVGQTSKINIVSVNGVSPTDKAKVLDNKYYISRFLYQYVQAKDIKGNVKKFLLFELSAEGQKIVEKIGFYPIGEDGAKKLNPFLFQ